MKETSKSKTKPKDPAGLLAVEACGVAQGMIDGGEVVSAEVLSRLVKLRVSAARDQFMDIKAAEQKAREAELEAKVKYLKYLISALWPHMRFIFVRFISYRFFFCFLLFRLKTQLVRKLQNLLKLQRNPRKAGSLNLTNQSSLARSLHR